MPREFGQNYSILCDLQPAPLVALPIQFHVNILRALKKPGADQSRTRSKTGKKHPSVNVNLYSSTARRFTSLRHFAPVAEV